MRPISAQVFVALSLMPFISGMPSGVLPDSLRVAGKYVEGSQIDETFNFIHSTKSSHKYLHLKSTVVK